MNNIIVKTTLLTAEEFEKQQNSLDNYVLRLLVLLVIAAIVLYGTDYLYKNCKNPLTFLINTMQKILTTSILAAFAWYSVQTLSYPLYNEVDKTKVQTKANLSEIKEHIKISEGKLTIESLAENYTYKNTDLNKNKSQDFEINESNKESNVKLIDSKNNKYEITYKQLEELKK